MCVVLSFVFLYLSYSFYSDGNTMGTLINGAIAILFIALIIRNILKTKAQKDKSKEKDKKRCQED